VYYLENKVLYVLNLSNSTHTIVDMRFFHTNVRYAALSLAVTAFDLIP